jgi:protein SCO1/2
MTETSSRGLSRFRLVLWGLVVLVAIGATLIFVMRPPAVNPVGLTGAPFTLQATTGGTFTQDSLKGKASLVFFGYTYCPDVCPTTLAELAGLRDQLKLTPDQLEIVFATVDPERDSVPVMAKYVSGFGTPIVGLSGTDAQVEAAKSAFGIYSKKVNDDGKGTYLVDHTATVFLLDKNGAFQGTIDFGENTATAQAKIKRLVAG